MKYLAILCTFFAFATNTLASGIDRNEGDKSLNFSFSEFAVDDYKYGIGGKYWLSNNTALTASVDFGKSEQDSESTIGGGSPTSLDADSTYYGFSVSVEKHFQSKTSLSPYYGGEIYYSESENDTTGGTSNNSESWGVNVLLGIEYSFTDSIALAAEYAYGYHEGESETTTTTGSSTNSSTGFGLYSSQLILLLYF